MRRGANFAPLLLYTQYSPETTYISSTKDVTGRFTKENGVSCDAIYLHFLHPSVLKKRRDVLPQTPRRF